MCVQGVCTSSSKAPISSCPFGNDVVINHLTIYASLPKPQMSCEDTFEFISTTLNQFPVTYCTYPQFKAACCSTCKSMNCDLHRVA